MIATAFIYLASLLIGIMLALLYPFQGSNGFPTGVDSAITAAASYTAKANTFISITAIHDVLMFVIAFEIILLYFYIMRWLFGYLPIIGGR